MKKTKLYQVLSNFSLWELRHLLQFVESPFFNRRSDVILLLKQFIAHRKTPRLPFLKDKTHLQHFPTYDKEQFFMVCSRLFKLTEQFLAFRHLKEDPLQLKQNTSLAYRKLKLDSFFEKNIQDAAKLLEKQNLRDSNYFFKTFQLEYERYDYIESHNRTKTSNLQQTIDAFDQYYFSQKLRIACYVEARKSVYKKNFDQDFLSSVINYIEAKPHLQEIPAIAIYYYCYLAMVRSENEVYFQQFRELIKTYKTYFDERESRDILLLAINYCIKQTNIGFSRYIEELFELYKNGIEEGVLIENNHLSTYTFNNAISAALQLKKYDWTVQFIQAYKKYLSPSDQNPISNYNLGRLYFLKKEYDKALDAIYNFSTKDYLLNLRARTLTIKIYYTLGESYADLMESQISSMKTYLHRKEIVGYHREYIQQFLSFLQQIINLPSFEKQKRAALREKIKNSKLLFEKEWLLSILE